MTEPDGLNTLYRQTVLDHSRQPHNFRRMEMPDRSATGHNPLCGDRITLYLRMAEDTIAEAAFEATGCAISVASASMLTDMVKGRAVDEARCMIGNVRDMLGGRTAPMPGEAIAALAGVRAYPARIRCATLPWQALEAALTGDAGPVTME